MTLLDNRAAAPMARSHSSRCPATVRSARVSFLGHPLDALSMEETVEQVVEMVACGLPHQHVCLNAAKLVLADDDSALSVILDGCELVSADGQSVVWGARLLGGDVPERIAGVDLFERLLATAEAGGLRVYFLGASRDALAGALDTVRDRHPRLKVAGARDGYWSSDEEAAVVTAVADAGADLLFVAMPSPKKEYFLARHGSRLGVPFLMGVGGSFDVLAGETRRAPRWMQRAGLEWTYRMLQEPRRMTRRYAVGNTRYVWMVLVALMKGRRCRQMSGEIPLELVPRQGTRA